VAPEFLVRWRVLTHSVHLLACYFQQWQCQDPKQLIFLVLEALSGYATILLMGNFWVFIPETRNRRLANWAAPWIRRPRLCMAAIGSAMTILISI